MSLAGATTDKANFLPENILCSTPAKMMWWKKSHVSQMFFNIDKPDEHPKEMELNGKFFSHPSLVFMRTTTNLHVYAMEGDTRPTLDTQLYDAPYFNLDDQGRLCFGNAARPSALLPSSVKNYEVAFFDTRFTHTNRRGIVRHNEGHFGFWKELITEEGQPVKSISMGHLVRYDGGKKLGDIL